ncbi:MAG: hypothetical protein PHZ19_05505 [Candidatus Thermoplasmatota archaeon]|nr:hypothetical protein [Candidatus Thermoplasmatota archaeon]
MHFRDRLSYRFPEPQQNANFTQAAEEPLPSDHIPVALLDLELPLMPKLKALETLARMSYRSGRIRDSARYLANFKALARAAGLTTHVHRTLHRIGPTVRRDLELRVERSAPGALQDKFLPAVARSILEKHRTGVIPSGRGH